MSTLVRWNGEVREIDIFEMLPPDEGEIDLFYGRIGAGKTYAGTQNILKQLKRGLVIYANWNLSWKGWDERNAKLLLLLGLTGIKKVFFDIPTRNFHFWNLVKGEIDGKAYREYFNAYAEKFFDEKGTEREMGFSDVLARLTDCSVHLDEGHIPFDSYEATRMSEQKRSAVFAMRHYDRKLTVYTQRANSVHVNLRGNTNRFYKCEKTMDITLFKKRFIHFLLTEFQDLTTSGAVDEALKTDEEGKEIKGGYRFAVKQWRYWGRKNTFEHFDSKYLRAGAGHSQPNFADAYVLTVKEIWRRLWARKVR